MGVNVLAIGTGDVEALVVLQVQRVCTVDALVLGGSRAAETVLIAVETQMDHGIQIIIGKTACAVDKTVTGQASRWTIDALVVRSV